ncbi:BTAD domain-containing putative transcriptional regulator [Streptomyces sp. NPDC127033]|uniref:AfsR/SARP family transcriptional regulator n=1 Tax=Streptomyces sp. NPDC127033 TaxID=3347110 RepID=UPI00364614F2
MLFRILGAPEVYDERSRRGIRLTSPMQGTLLGALLARPGTVVSVEGLVHELWGDAPPAKSANALQAHVSRLRQTLALLEAERGRPRLVTHRSGYVLRADELETDSGRFRLGVARARQTAARDPQAAYHQLRRALPLWRGKVLQGSVLGPLGIALTDDLERVGRDALATLLDTALRTGRAEQVLEEVRRVADSHPASSRFREQLALALRRRGRPSGADPVPPVPSAGRRRPVRPPVPVRTPEAAGDGRGPADEVDRLRALVRHLASEQQSLRTRLELLTDLVSNGEWRPREPGGVSCAAG